MPFDSAVLNELVNNTVLKLKENKAHSVILRQELSSYLFESPDEDRYHHLRDIFESKDIQRIAALRNFMGSIMTFFRGLTRNAATLLAEFAGILQ